MAFHDPRPLGFLHFPCFSDALFLILLGGKALAHGQERGQWKGETAPKHIWQLSQSLAGEMGKGTGTGTLEGKTRGYGYKSRNRSSKRNRSRMPGHWTGCRLPVGNRTTGLRHMSWIAWYMAKLNAGESWEQNRSCQDTEKNGNLMGISVLFSL